MPTSPMVSFTTKSFQRLAAIACAALMLSTATVVADDVSVKQLESLVSAGDIDSAVSVARSLDEQAASTIDLTLPLARFARALQKAKDLELAAEFYQRSVDASTKPKAAALAPEKTILIRLAAGSLLAQTNKLSEAIAVLRPMLDSDSSASDTQRQMAVSICLKIGALALSGGALSTTSEAYAVALAHADKNHRATAMLGDAWVTALQNTQPLAAAEKLSRFIDQYPQHADASRAARACAECFKRAGRVEDASRMVADLLQHWPDSESASEAVRSHRDLAVDLVPPAVRNWLMGKAKADNLKTLDAKMTMLGIMVATQQHELAAWTNLVKHLASIDQSGQTTSDLLAGLVDGGKMADAERLAALFIASIDGSDVSPGAREAACRWAGRTLRWSMLAFASESESRAEPNPSRTVTVDTLFAEALMQTGRIEEARHWWDYLVDSRGVDRFSTLLRCAEAETAVGSDLLLAEQRITAARVAARDDRYRISLVDLMDAELSVRRLQFDQARALLESVIRSSETDSGVRGRAQWLIGETHYLQRKFHEAIEAYRRVEGIDPHGQWVSASLLQAGKSFEQLGRTREAAVCYGNLLSRFSDASHAELARRRLAAIAPDTNPSNDNSSQRTIRR
jgi:TolA-binding protein